MRELTDDWKSFGGPGDFTASNTIIAAIFARSTRTYEAVVKHLGNKDFWYPIKRPAHLQ